MQSTYRNSQQIVRSHQTTVSRSQVFLDFFNRGLYELQGQDLENQQLGAVEVFHMNQREFDRQQRAIEDQKNFINTQSVSQARQTSLNPEYNLSGQQIRNQQGQIVGHQRLRPYALDAELPKWLPFRVAKKVVNNPSQQQIDQMRQFVDIHAQERLNKSPEFSHIYAYQVVNNGQQLVVYYEYLNILQDEINERRAGKQPFTEELLWSLLFGLVAASANAGPQLSLTDVRPSRIFYENYKGQVLPYELTEQRNISLQQKLQNNEQVFASPEFEAELRSSRIGQSATLSKNFNNESYQIGCSVLAAGLLLNERDLGLAGPNGFNQQRLSNLLNDFGQIYGRQDRLLQFVLQELFLSQNRLTPSQIYNLLRDHYQYAIFLDLQFKQNLRQQLTRDSSIQNNLFNFEQTHPSSLSVQNLPRDFLQRYEDLFFYQLHGKNAVRPSVTLQNRSGLNNSGVLGNTVRISSNNEGHANPVYRNSQAIASQLIGGNLQSRN